jgi:hypothetical protein
LSAPLTVADVLELLNAIPSVMAKETRIVIVSGVRVAAYAEVTGPLFEQAVAMELTRDAGGKPIVIFKSEWP